jgi:hypothetical protein
MNNFCPDQGRTRVYGEAYACTPQPETRGERRAQGKKGHLGLGVEQGKSSLAGAGRQTTDRIWASGNSKRKFSGF